MKHIVFVMAGFVLMLFSGNLHAQVQGGMDSKPTDKPQASANSRTGMNTQKHEKMKTQGNDVKLERSSKMARGDAEVPTQKPKSDAKKKEKKSSK